MYLIFHDLLAQYDHAWIVNHILMYANDIHLRWIIISPSEGLAAMHDMSFLFRIFRAYGLRINQQKSVAIIRLMGKASNPFLRRWTSRPITGPVLHLPDTQLTVPLVSKTSYLMYHHQFPGMGSRHSSNKGCCSSDMLPYSPQVASWQAS